MFRDRSRSNFLEGRIRIRSISNCNYAKNLSFCKVLTFISKSVFSNISEYIILALDQGYRRQDERKESVSTTLGPFNHILPDRQASDVNHNQVTDRLLSTIRQSTKCKTILSITSRQIDHLSETNAYELKN